MLTKIVVMICIVLICVENDIGFVDARYLPTRGNSDNLDRLRDLLSDILETDVHKRGSFDSAPSLTAASSPIRYDALNDDDFSMVIPKHMLNNHQNSRLIFKRGIINKSLKQNF